MFDYATSAPRHCAQAPLPPPTHSPITLAQPNTPPPVELTLVYIPQLIFAQTCGTRNDFSILGISNFPLSLRKFLSYGGNSLAMGIPEFRLSLATLSYVWTGRFGL